MKMKIVYVLTIDHKHGQNVYVNRTEEGARKELETYVTENWESEMPADRYIQVSDNAVGEYFHETEGEFYNIECCEVGD